MLGSGQGINAWYQSLGLVPNAVNGVTSSLGGAMENIARRREQQNAEERRRRDIKTAERKQQQGMLTNIGIGVGGAALGAGLGSLLAAPAAGAAGALAPQIAAETAMLGTVPGATALAAPTAVGAAGMAGGSGLGAAAGGAVGGGLGGVGAAAMPKPNQFGYLGNTRGQAFGNLFLQGLAPVVPGMAGVASGINQANQMNYQMGRDAIGDQRWQQQFGLQQEGLGIDREQLAATIANQQFKQGISAADLQRKIAEDAARNNRFGLSLDSTNQYRSDMVGLGRERIGLDRDRLTETVSNNANRLGLGQERNDIMRERNALGGSGGLGLGIIPEIEGAIQRGYIGEGQGPDTYQTYRGLKAKKSATNPIRDAKDLAGIIKTLDDVGATGDPTLDATLGDIKARLSGMGGNGPQLNPQQQALEDMKDQMDPALYQKKRKELGY